jgi:SulP family sulfate permease
MRWRKYFPLAEQLKDYSKNRFRFDLIAGLTVCIMLVPQGMAYALLAGVPPIYGLYAGVVPLFIYGLMSSTRQVSIGPVAVSALLVLAGVSQIAVPGSPEYITLVILAGLLIGIAQFTMGLFRLGFLVNLLSNPVIMGFTSAAAIIIGVSQLKYLFGIKVPRFEQLYETVYYVFSHLQETHWLSFAICSGAIFIMLALKKWAPAVPGALLVTIIGIVLSSYLMLESHGLIIVGDIPAGFPPFQFPKITWNKVQLLGPTILTVTIMSVVETISIGKALEIKNKQSGIRPNQELFALGASKMIGALFQAIPSSASFTRSAVNNDSGANTGLASIIAALATSLVLVFFTPLFYYLPEAILAAIVLVAIRGLFEIKGIAQLWNIDRRDFYMAVITFLATIGLGIAEGVFTGVALSLLSVLFQSSRPHIAVLGQLPNSDYFRNIKRYPEAIQHEGVLIIRFDASLFFLNAAYFKDKIQKRVNRYPGNLEVLILDTSSIINVDSSGLSALRDLHRWCTDQNITLYLAGTMGPVRDSLARADLRSLIGPDHFFRHPIDAIEFAQKD